MRLIKINIKNKEGQNISAVLETPLSTPVAYAIFAHCFTCSKDITAARNITRSLNTEGIGVIRFDFTGLGESEGEFSDTNFSSNVDDLITANEPESAGGNDLGASPYGLLLSSLGACTGITLKMYANRKNWKLEEVLIHLSHDKIYAEDCRECETETGKIDKIERKIKLKGKLDDKQKQRLMEIADRCPVHRTLHSEILVKTSMIS